VVLFEDETLLREFPPLRAGWAKRGEQVRVPITGNNARRCVFGVLNPKTGTRLCWTRLRNRAEDFRDVLREVRARYRRWDILMILDQGSSHTAKKTHQMAAELRIAFAFLPTACPELNPVELLWRSGKQNVSANRTYARVSEQADAFTSFLLGMTNLEALQTAGVRSKNFWLPT
jgi:transposase